MIARLTSAVLALLLSLPATYAQAPSPISGVSPELLDDLALGSRILAEFGVVDAFGHVSARSPANPSHFLMSRSLAPALVTADDIMEFDADGNAGASERDI